MKVDETWDSIAMRGSGSHDLVLENVHVDEDDLVQKLTPGKKNLLDGYYIYLHAILESHKLHKSLPLHLLQHIHRIALKAPYRNCQILSKK